MPSRFTRRVVPRPSRSDAASPSNGTARSQRTSLFAALAVLLLLSPAAEAEGEALWTLLKGGGQVVLIRHASTDPAVGDPPGFRLDDCATLFGDRSREPQQTQAIRRLASERPASGNLILVTHGFNIRALTGILPATGEMVILTPQGNGAFLLAGRLPLQER